MLRFMRMGSKRTKTIWWVLIIVTVVTFLGGFVFILGSGLDSSNRARAAGAVGTVNGTPISRAEYQNAVTNARDGFKRQYGEDPGDRDAQLLSVQAWRRLVIEHLMSEKARELGLTASDREVIVALQSNPPQEVTSAPGLQTDGKFDPAKYQAFMTDPRYVEEVARIEEVTRRQLPMRKFQERLLTSVKLTEPELNEAFRDRFERLSATVVHVPAIAAGNLPAPTDADLDRVYQRYKNRFASGARTQLEVLIVPKKLGEGETRTARELAQSLANRARGGEDFATLASVYSTAPGAEKGGVIDREFQAAEFGPELGATIMALDVGGISNPIEEGGRLMIFKVLSKTPNPTTGVPAFRLAQIEVKVEPDPETLRQQYESLVKIRGRAVKIGLGKAAAAGGMPTALTGFFDPDNAPPELFGVPQAADWSMGAKTGAVSPVFAGIDEFAMVQVAAQRSAGPVPREQLTEPLRQIAQREARIEQSKRVADVVARSLAEGKSLEAAAAAAGVTPVTIDAMTRLQPDPRLATAPEVVGALFGARTGQVVGPIRVLDPSPTRAGFDGWYFGRPNQTVPADTAMFDQIKGQISSELLQLRQRTFLSSYLNTIRAKAAVKDLRDEPAY